MGADLAESSDKASQSATTVCFTPESLRQTTLGTRARFDQAFIKVLVRRLHAAQESLAQAAPRAARPVEVPRAPSRSFANSRFG